MSSVRDRIRALNSTESSPVEPPISGRNGRSPQLRPRTGSPSPSSSPADASAASRGAEAQAKVTVDASPDGGEQGSGRKGVHDLRKALSQLTPPAATTASPARVPSPSQAAALRISPKAPSPRLVPSAGSPTAGGAPLPPQATPPQGSVETITRRLSGLSVQQAKAPEAARESPEGAAAEQAQAEGGARPGSPTLRTTVNVRQLSQSEDRMMSKLMAVVEKLQQELFDVEGFRKRAEGTAAERRAHISKLREGLRETQHDGVWLDREALRLQAGLDAGLLRRSGLQDAIMRKQDQVSAVEQQLMERAADIRGRKARIESLEGQLKAALAQAAALAASPADVKSSVWSTNMSDDEDPAPGAEASGAASGGRRTISLTGMASTISAQEFGVPPKHRTATADGGVAAAAAEDGKSHHEQPEHAGEPVASTPTAAAAGWFAGVTRRLSSAPYGISRASVAPGPQGPQEAE